MSRSATIVVLLAALGGALLWISTRPPRAAELPAPAVVREAPADAPADEPGRVPLGAGIERGAEVAPQAPPSAPSTPTTAGNDRRSARGEATAVVSGSVASARGGPIAGAELRIGIVMGPFRRELGPFASDAEGRFHVPVPDLAALGREQPPPEVWVRMSADGFRAQEQRAFQNPSQKDVWAVQARLVEGVTVQGRVVDPSGEPVAGAEVTARLEAPAVGPGAMAVLKTTGQAATDGEGRFRLGISEEGADRIDVRKLGVGAAAIELEGRAPADVGTVALAELERLAGQVFDPDGRPAAGVHLLAQRTPQAEGGGARPARSDPGSSVQHLGWKSETHSDALGRFELRDLVRGTYRLTAQHADAASAGGASGRAQPLHAQGDPRVQLFATGSDAQLELDAHRLKVVVDAPAGGEGPRLVRVACVPAESLETMLARPSVLGRAVRPGEPLWFRVPPGERMAVLAWRAGDQGVRARMEIGELTTSTTAYEQEITLTVP